MTKQAFDIGILNQYIEHAGVDDKLTWDYKRYILNLQRGLVNFYFVKMKWKSFDTLNSADLFIIINLKINNLIWYKYKFIIIYEFSF